MNQEKFLWYNSRRDLVFILGAGASHPEGVPLQKDIIPIMFSGDYPEIENSDLGKKVLEFIRENFTISEKENIYPEMEAVFGFLDYFITENESLNSKYTYSALREIREALIKLIHYVINQSSDKVSSVYKEFWRLIDNHNRNSSIITLNYDTMLEQSFEFLFPHKGLIDYSIHFMNFEKDQRLKAYNFWINTREPIKIKDNSEPVSYKIIKLHGSLNWKYCNCCNQILLTPWDRKIDLNKGELMGYTYPDNQEYEFRCPLDGTRFQTLIVPPSLIKPLKHPSISFLLNEASKEIRSAKKIVFIGYSLSIADVHIKALLKKNLNPATEVIAVNLQNTPTLKSRYQEIKGDIHWINSSFEEMISDGKLIDKIF